MENNYCVYCHLNKINGKRYIGITKHGDNPEKRWRYGSGYAHQEKGLGGAIQKYGWHNFDHIILKEHLTLEDALRQEKYYIKEYKVDKKIIDTREPVIKQKKFLKRLYIFLGIGCIVYYIFNMGSICLCCSVVSDSLRPHGLQHARLPCPSPSPGACSNSCPLSR